MNWFKKFKMSFLRANFESSVLLCCSNLIQELLLDENNKARDSLQKTIGNNCFDIIREKSSEQDLADCRKRIIDKVTRIVKSDNPLISMRRKLISLIHSDTLNRSFLLEQYGNRRQELYEELNKYMDDAEILNSDETASILFIWSEAECCILRCLQSKYFESVGKEDWFSGYCKVYEMFVTSLFDLTLAQIDKEDISIYSITLPIQKKQVEHFQKELIGEVIG